jgi:hypothetical protein
MAFTKTGCGAKKGGSIDNEREAVAPVITAPREAADVHLGPLTNSRRA